LDDPTPSQQALDRWMHSFPLWGEILAWIALSVLCMGLIALLMSRRTR